jgi:hypothetical protein
MERQKLADQCDTGPIRQRHIRDDEVRVQLIHGTESGRAVPDRPDDSKIAFEFEKRPQPVA